MFTKQELQAMRARALENARDIRNVAKAADRNLSEDEVGQAEKLIADATDYQTKIEAIDKQDSMFDGIDDQIDQLGNAPVSKTAAQNAPLDIVVGADLIEKDPKKGFKTPKQFMLAVMKEGDAIPSQASDKRLRFLAAAGTDEHSTFNNTHGGWLVPEAFANDPLSIAAEEDVIASLTRSVPMEKPTLNIPARTDKDHNVSVAGGIVVERRAESAKFKDSRLDLENVELKAHMLAGLSFSTEELLEDSPSTFAALLSTSFQEAFANKLMQERISGTGVGEYQGILKSKALIKVARDQTGDIVFQDALNMRIRAYKYQRCVWMATEDFIAKMAVFNIDNPGVAGIGRNPLGLTNAQDNLPDTLLGRPVIYTEHSPAIDKLGGLLLVNWGEYLEGTYSPMQSDESMHVRFIEHERVFKMWTRNAGAGWWRSELKPKNGSTKSPFVSLDV